MRWIGWLLTLLVALGWMASEYGPSRPISAAQPAVDTWRQTQNGWERATWLVPEVPVRKPCLHPCVVGLLELFLSATAMIALATGAGSKRAETSSPRTRASCQTDPADVD